MARSEPSQEREILVPYLRGLVLNEEDISLRVLRDTYRGREEAIQKELGGTYIASLSRKGPAFVKRAQKIYRFFKATPEEQERILATEEPLNPKELSFLWRVNLRGYKLLRQLDLQDVALHNETFFHTDTDPEETSTRVTQLIAEATTLLSEKNRHKKTFKETALGEHLLLAIKTLQHTFYTYLSSHPMPTRKKSPETALKTAAPLKENLTLSQAEAALNTVLESKANVTFERIAEIAIGHEDKIRMRASITNINAKQKGNKIVTARSQAVFDFLSATPEKRAEMISAGHELPLSPTAVVREASTKKTAPGATTETTPAQTPHRNARVGRASRGADEEPTSPVRTVNTHRDWAESDKGSDAAPASDIAKTRFYRELKVYLGSQGTLTWQQLSKDCDGQEIRTLEALSVLIPEAEKSGNTALLNRAEAVQAFLTLPEEKQLGLRKEELKNTIRDLTDTERKDSTAERLYRELGRIQHRMTELSPPVKSVPSSQAPRAARESTTRTRPSPHKINERSDIFDKPYDATRARYTDPELLYPTLGGPRQDFLQTGNNALDLKRPFAKTSISDSATKSFRERFLNGQRDQAPQESSQPNDVSAFDTFNVEVPQDWRTTFGAARGKQGANEGGPKQPFTLDNNLKDLLTTPEPLGRVRRASDLTEELFEAHRDQLEENIAVDEREFSVDIRKQADRLLKDVLEKNSWLRQVLNSSSSAPEKKFLAQAKSLLVQAEAALLVPSEKLGGTFRQTATGKSLHLAISALDRTLQTLDARMNLLGQEPVDFVGEVQAKPVRHTAAEQRAGRRERPRITGEDLKAALKPAFPATAEPVKKPLEDSSARGAMTLDQILEEVGEPRDASIPADRSLARIPRANAVSRVERTFRALDKTAHHAEAELSRVEASFAALKRMVAVQTNSLRSSMELQERLMQLRLELKEVALTYRDTDQTPRYAALWREITQMHVNNQANVRVFQDQNEQLDRQERSLPLQDLPSAYRPTRRDATLQQSKNLRESLDTSRTQTTQEFSEVYEKTRLDLERLRARIHAGNVVAEASRETFSRADQTSADAEPDFEVINDFTPLRPTPQARASEKRHIDLIETSRSIPEQIKDAAYQSSTLIEQEQAVKTELDNASDLNRHRLSDELVHASAAANRALRREYLLRTGDPRGMAKHLDRTLDELRRISNDPTGRMVMDRIEASEKAGDEFTIEDAREIPDTEERRIALRILEIRHETNRTVNGTDHLRTYHEAELRLVTHHADLVEKCVNCHLPEELQTILKATLSRTDKRAIVEEILRDPHILDNPKDFWGKIAKGVVGVMRTLTNNDLATIPLTNRRFGNKAFNVLINTINKEKESLDALDAERSLLRDIVPTGTASETRTPSGSDGSGNPLEASLNVDAPSHLQGELRSMWDRSDALRKELESFTGTITEDAITRFNARLSSLEESQADIQDSVPADASTFYTLAIAKIKEARDAFNALRAKADEQSPRGADAPERTEARLSPEEELERIEIKADTLIQQVQKAIDSRQALSPQDFRDFDHETIILSTRLRNLNEHEHLLAYKLAASQLKDLNDTLDEYEETTPPERLFDQRKPLEQLLDNAVEVGVRKILTNAPERAALRTALMQLNDGNPVRIERAEDVKQILKAFLRRYSRLTPKQQLDITSPFDQTLELLGMETIYEELGLDSLDALSTSFAPASLDRTSTNDNTTPKQDDFDLAA